MSARPLPSPEPSAEELALARNLKGLAAPPPQPPGFERLNARIEALLTPPDDMARSAVDGLAEAGGAPSLCYKSQVPDRPAEHRPLEARARREGEPMKLQACPKCGAQFDVSSFSGGQQFRCGACGQLMTADGAAGPQASGRVPPPAIGERMQATRAPGPRVPEPSAPSASSVGAAKSPRGPQFQPAQRAQEPTRAAAAPPARAGREERPSRAGRNQGAPRKGPPMALIAGGGALAVLAIVLVVVLGGKDPKKPGAGGGTPSALGNAPGGGVPAAAPVVAKETLAEVRADYRRNKPEKDSEWKAFIARFGALGGEAAEDLKSLYEVYVETRTGSDDPGARKALGYVEFKHPLPEEISQTKGRDFITAFEVANHQRWLQGEEEIRLANDAWKRVQEHARRLREDRVYAAGDGIWNNILQDKLFKDQNFATRWSAPHLICYASKDRLSDLDLLSLPRSERKKKREELAAKRAQFEPLLDEKERIYVQLYTEFNRRFKDVLGLQDLAAEYGGRPDLVKKGTASFRDGVPLVVWIFDGRESFDEFHKVKKMPLPPGVGGYFEWSTAWIYLFDEKNEGDARIWEVSKNLHEGSHQLEHWFGMQLNGWKEPKHAQSWLGEGMAEYFGSHKMKADGSLEFVNLNVGRVREAKRFRDDFKGKGKEYPIVKLEKLTSWESYNEAMQHAQDLGMDPRDGQLIFIYEQGHMLFHMCMEGLGGKYRDKIMAYIKSVLMREEGGEHFRRCFKIRDEDDWEELQKDFEAYVKELLAKDLSGLIYAPVKRASPAKPGDGK